MKCSNNLRDTATTYTISGVIAWISAIISFAAFSDTYNKSGLVMGFGSVGLALLFGKRRKDHLKEADQIEALRDLSKF